jgi:hypothetical protein
MADWEYPLEALKTAAEQKLSVVGGATARHYVGRKYVYGNHDAPRYVWVPNRGRETSDLYTVEADQVPMLSALEDRFFVCCWGRTLAEAWAMANNVNLAIHTAIKADRQLLQNYEWERPGEAHNQRGELVVLEFAMGIPFIRAYVDLDPAAQEPEAPTVQPLSYEADMQQTDDPEQPGETALTVTTEPA